MLNQRKVYETEYGSSGNDYVPTMEAICSCCDGREFSPDFPLDQNRVGLLDKEFKFVESFGVRYSGWKVFISVDGLELRLGYNFLVYKK